jgi:hypothetical protein
MKKMLLALGLVALTAAPALAVEKPIRLGLDFGMPYALTVDGNSLNERGNFNIGLDGRYWATDNINYGVRFGFDVEEQNGMPMMYTMAPGMQYHWMPTESWQPFVRFDLPLVLAGAMNGTGSSSTFDMGIATGIGLAWNLGSMIGVENLSIRYDFDVNYLFGIGDALPVLALDLFKIGFDYRF